MPSNSTSSVPPMSMASASVAAASKSPTASDSEEYEYEEIEIEEEVEVEEEVSDEEDGEEGEEEEEEDEDEIGEDLSPPTVDEDHQKGKRTLVDDGDMLYNDKALQSDGGMKSAETSNPVVVSGKEVKVSEESVIEGANEDNRPHSEKGIMGTSAEDVLDKQQKQPGRDGVLVRLDVPLIRPRSLSPGMETKEGNKRPVLACEFFAKGWCIKGNSCRFLHIREPMNVSDQQQESYVAADQKSEFQDRQGSREGTGRFGLATAPNTFSPSKMSQLQEPKESPKWKGKHEELHKENPITISSFGDVGRENPREKQNMDRDNSPVNTDGSLHGTFLNSPFKGVDKFGTNLEELGGGRNQFRLHDRNMPIFSNSLNTSSSSAQSTMQMSSLNHGSIWTSTSMLFSSSSWNSDSFRTLKHLDGDRELHDSRSASLQRSVSPFSASAPEHLYQNKVSGDRHSAGYATRFSTYDWEPSKPFRSSFLISQGLSPGSLYDPIRDSIELPTFGVSKFSSFCQGPSILSRNSPRNINPPVNGTSDVDYGIDRHSVASHDKAMDANSNACAVGIVATEQQNKLNAEKEHKHPSHVYIGDIMQASEAHVNNDESTKKALKVGDEASQNHKLDIEIKGDAVMHRESKAVKHFRAALIEFVKEIVKPAWREGNLSKDAHKLIVKKAVDKVLNTLPAENVPSTQDSVDLYLSSCQPKLVKLVEGYITKYGKS